MLGRVLKNLFGLESGAGTLQAGISAYDRGELGAAGRLLDAALRAEPRNATARYYAGLIARKSGRHRDALQHLEHAIELDPGNAECCHQAAATEYLLGDARAAWRRCEALLERVPDHTPSRQLMSRIALPGLHYTKILRVIHQTLRPRTYFEIGVFTGDSIALARPETRVIGVDPDPKIPSHLPVGTTVHAMTSDDYFAARDVSAELGGLPIDLAFIDGLHLFEQALRDFIHVEKFSAPASTVLLHDCYPLDRRTAERVQATAFSSGDVWRVILALKKYRPELRINVVATPPTGLAVVRGLDPGSDKLSQHFDEIVAEFMAIDYGMLEGDKPRLLNLFPNDPAEIRKLLE